MQGASQDYMGVENKARADQHGIFSSEGPMTHTDFTATDESNDFFPIARKIKLSCVMQFGKQRSYW